MMQNNCIMGNDPGIVPVVVAHQQQPSRVEVASNFVQNLGGNKCDFLSVVTGGSLYSTLHNHNGTCIRSDAFFCGASTLNKVLDQIPCMDSLQPILDNELSVSGHDIMEDEWPTRTYILCPNTTFSASTAITISKPNVRILCSPDGSSQHNCVIQGGQEQLVLQGSGVYHVRGVTFADASYINVHCAFSHVQAELDDCIFRVRVHWMTNRW